MRTLEGHAKAVWAAVFIAGNRCVVSVSRDETLRVWDLATGQWLQTLRDDSGALRCLAASPDGKTIVTGGRDKKIKVWAVRT